MQTLNNTNYPWTARQATLLKRVNLTVYKDPPESEEQWLFTKVELKDGEYQDPCAGDSGGPLMYKTPQSDKWVIIGTVQGGGFDCRDGDLIGNKTGQAYGRWNRVLAYVDWIQGQIDGDDSITTENQGSSLQRKPRLMSRKFPGDRRLL